MADNQEYQCGYCQHFIYEKYSCSAGHVLCDYCVRWKGCTICNDRTFKNISFDNSNCPRKSCKNHEIGCSDKIYEFDTVHEQDCLFNPFKCEFCNHFINTKSNEAAIDHFKSGCSNDFNIIRFCKNSTDKETKGRKYILDSITKQLTLIVMDDEYLVILVPKGEMIKFIVFSLENKYKLSNYQVKISGKDRQEDIFIQYNTMLGHMFELSWLIKPSEQTKLEFSIENLYIINRKVESTQIGDDTFFVESHTVEGEPGSAGHWTKEQSDDMRAQLIDMFKSFRTNA